MALPEEPITRNEMYLSAIAGEDTPLPDPITREEMYLWYIADTGGVGGKPYNYTDDGNGNITITPVADEGDE